MFNSASSEPTTEPRAPRGEDHDRGLQTLRVRVLAITEPAPSVCRVSVVLPPDADLAAWGQPNVAFRIHLGGVFGQMTRVYTVRDVDAATGRMRFDVVRHGDASPMMRWMQALHVGSLFEITGARPHLQFPPSKGRCVAMFLDQTAIPALHALFSHAGPDLCGVACIASDDPVPVTELPEMPGVAIIRVPATSDSDELLQLARNLAHPTEHVIWGAGEREQMRAIRQYFCSEMGLPRQDVALSGYWKRGESNSETDVKRLRNYERLLARGGSIVDFDDLSSDI